MCTMKRVFWTLFITVLSAGFVFASVSEKDPADFIPSQIFNNTHVDSAAKSITREIKASPKLSYIEYLYATSGTGIYLIQINHPADQVCSALLFPFNLAGFYGAAGSADADSFWATSNGNPTNGAGSALYRIYPAEKAAVKISDSYGQDPRYPTNPAYVINMRELAYDDDTDTLYGTDYKGLYTIDPATGLASYIGDFGIGQDGKPIEQTWSLAYASESQKLILVNQQLDDNFVRIGTQMYTVNPATAAVTYIGDTTAVGMTDIYESRQSNQLYGIRNFEHEVYDVNSVTGLAQSRGLIAHNLLGLGGDFIETAGPRISFPFLYARTAASAASELDGTVNVASDNDSGTHATVTSLATAFTQEAGQSSGIGQQSAMTVSAASTNSLTQCSFSPSVAFTSDYNGPNQHGRGGGSASISCDNHIRIDSDATWTVGDRVLVLVEGSRTLDNQISRYALDWQMEVYELNIERPVTRLTEQDLPATASTPFLGAFQAAVGSSYDYWLRFTMTLDVEMLAGDINADGRVDMTDFEAFARQWPDEDCDASNDWCGQTDLDESGQVNLDDLSLLAADWIQGNVWDDDNEFNLDMNFTFRTIALPETPQTLNDQCQDALVIMADTEYFGTTEGTTGTDLSSCGNNDIYDVWYNFVPTQDGLYQIYVESSDYVSPCVSLFDGCGGAELACWTTGSSVGYASGCFFEATAWTSYLIRVADYSYSTGDFKLIVLHHPIPDNDECAGAFPLEPDHFYEGRNNFGATNDSTSSCGTDDTHDVWYKYTAQDDNNVLFTVFPYEDEPPYYTASLFDGCDELTRTELICGVYEENGREEKTTVVILENPQPGQTYYLRVARNESEYGQFALETRPGPVNDKCSRAQSISANNYTWGSTWGAGGSDVSYCGWNDSRDIWYALTSDQTQQVLIRAYSGEMNPFTVSLFDACGGYELACAESCEGYEGEMKAQIIHPCNAWQTVYVRIAFTDGQMGEYYLETIPLIPPQNDECQNAEVLDTGYPCAEGSTLGADGSDQSSCGTNDTHDVWYTFTPDQTEYYTAVIYRTEGAFSGVLTVFDGQSCDPLSSELACEEMYDDYAEIYDLELTGGQTYLIRVGSDDAGQGFFGLDIYPSGY